MQDNEEPFDDVVEESSDSIIKPIDTKTIHQICSGQVITSMSSAVKELIENSLDAGATRIEILFKDEGLDTIQISDNGTGIDPSNYRSIVKKHHTSKLRSFEDLHYVTSFGFRGEALSSLCAVCSLSILSRTKSQPLATQLRFDHDNNLIEMQEGALAREVGTTVTCLNLFKNYPVRLKQLKKNLKREYTKTIDLIESYCLISSGLRVTVHNQSSNQRNKKLVIQTSGSSIRENICTILGSSCFKKMQEINVNRAEYSLAGYISKIDIGSGRSSSDRQYLFLNGRPVDLDKVTKTINSVYKQYNQNQYPIFVLNLLMRTESYDVNVTPDKRKVFLEDEMSALLFVRDILEEIYSPKSRVLSKNTTIEDFIQRLDSVNNTVIDRIEEDREPQTQQFDEPPKIQTTSKKRKFMPESDSGSDEEADATPVPKQRKLIIHSPRSKRMKTISDTPTVTSKERDQYCHCAHQSDVCPVSPVNSMDTHQHIILDSEIERAELTESDSPIVFSVSTRDIIETMQCVMASRDQPNKKAKVFHNTVGNNAQDCEEELSSNLMKQDFANMRIIGQFNKGFIITELDGSLFIIDQHASDEKYNYEDLQANTKLNIQPLILPKKLDLSSADVLLVMDHIDIFEKNGFRLSVDWEAPISERVKLTAVPHSKSVVFNEKDVHELIFLLKDIDPTIMNIRPSKVSSIFASRACRKSIMIGKTLSHVDMKRVVSNLSTLNQPWNCPHGRPTIRYLTDVQRIETKTQTYQFLHRHLTKTTTKERRFSHDNNLCLNFKYDA